MIGKKIKFAFSGIKSEVLSTQKQLQTRMVLLQGMEEKRKRMETDDRTKKTGPENVPKAKYWQMKVNV